MAQLQKPSPWGKFLCYQGRHQAKERAINALLESSSGRVESTCKRCGQKIALEIDPNDQETFFIKDI